MSQLSIVFICVVAAILSALLKQNGSLFSLLLICGCGIVVIAVIMSDFLSLSGEIISAVSGIENASEYIKILIKAIVICIIAEVASNICKDSGNNSISFYVDIVAKILIFSLTLPLVKQLIEIIQELFK